MANESKKQDSGKSLSDRLGINEKTGSTALNDLTNHDGSEDPGSELDSEFSYISRKDGNMSDTKIDKVPTIQETSKTPPKSEELKVVTDNALKKKKLEKTHPVPQADEILNPELNSENDI